MSKTVLITGILGQDGSYMLDYLLDNTDHNVVGMARHYANPNYKNIQHRLSEPRFKLMFGDLTDSNSVESIVEEVMPDYIINLGANSFVGVSWKAPEHVLDVNTMGVIRLLEAIKNKNPDCRFYQAGCYDKDTRIVTRDGLKSVEEVNEGDYVVSMNPDTTEVEYKKITRLIKYHHEGEMIKIAGKGKDLLVTPNHNMYYQTKDNKLLSCRADEFINKSRATFPQPKGINNTKKLDKVIDLSEFIPTKSREYNVEVQSIESDDLLYLMGLYIGDGSSNIMTKSGFHPPMGYNRDEETGQFTSTSTKEKREVEYKSARCTIDVPREDPTFNKLTSVLDKNEIRWKLHGECDVTFFSWGLFHFFDQCGHKSNEKKIPDWVFDLDIDSQRLIFDGIMDSDGCSERLTIEQTSKTLAEQLLVLAANIGLRASLSSRDPRVTKLKDGREIRGNHKTYTIYFSNRKVHYQKNIDTKWYSSNENFEKVDYNDYVWCLEVEDNHNFLVERNGKTVFCGNSSEEWGDILYSPQDEEHPLRPRSPYGASKASARHLVKVYRESYNIYAVQGFLLNHECIFPNTPVLVSVDDKIKVDYVRNLMPEKTIHNKNSYVLSRDFDNLKIWDGEKFAKINAITRRRISTLEAENQKSVYINTRNGVVETTPNHSLYVDNQKTKVRDLHLDDELNHVDFPVIGGKIKYTPEQCKILGYLVGDGYVGDSSFRLINGNEAILHDFIKCVESTYPNAKCTISDNASGFGGKGSKKVDVSGLVAETRVYREAIYDSKTKHKKVPDGILNADRESKELFFKAYYACDGLRFKNNDFWNLEWKSFKTNSPLLAHGLLILLNELSGQDVTINVFEQNEKFYYQVNILTGSPKGKSMLLPKREVKKIISRDQKDCMVYDIETESGYFSGGVGKIKIGNSERRAECFVTRKITKGVARIIKELKENGKCVPINLGNLDSNRDWSHALDFCDAIWRMLNQDKYNQNFDTTKPVSEAIKEYVVASGEAHSIRDFVEQSFKIAGIEGDWEYQSEDKDPLSETYVDKSGNVLVCVNPEYFRPAEVDFLCGDSTKIREDLGWEPKIDFNKLVELMTKNDLEND